MPATLATRQEVRTGDARRLSPHAESGSVALVVTSPPYPMIEMWDATFAAMSRRAARALARGAAGEAFEACHAELDRAWAECARVLIDGGLLCIVVGDAVRTIGGTFRLLPNHARILSAAGALGLTPLPDIIWRKPTNAPTKFLGSGMLPAGAYVTYEHEHILVFRKGGPRAFRSAAERRRRLESAFFREERNTWFSDVWTDLRGATQDLRRALVTKRPAAPLPRERSGAFPFEVAYRLVCMHSVAGDLVLDPFAGTGTTLVAAAAAGRSGLGIEVDPSLTAGARAALRSCVPLGQARTRRRIDEHHRAIAARRAQGLTTRYASEAYGFPIVTSQERALRLPWPVACRARPGGVVEVAYEETPWTS